MAKLLPRIGSRKNGHISSRKNARKSNPRHKQRQG